jgi:hypothetical protein
LVLSCCCCCCWCWSWCRTWGGESTQSRSPCSPTKPRRGTRWHSCSAATGAAIGGPRAPLLVPFFHVGAVFGFGRRSTLAGCGGGCGRRQAAVHWGQVRLETDSSA